MLGLDLAAMAHAMAPAGFAAQRMLVDRASAAGLAPDTATLNELLHRLQLEGHVS